MRVVLQRVSRAQVSVEERIVGRISEGLLLLVGFSPGDGLETIAWMAEKVRGLRVFSDEQGRMNRSVEDIGGGILVVSQFTLYGDARKGRRPSFADAAAPDVAVPLYESFIAELRKTGILVATGEFGAQMDVELVNDGPVTLFLER